MDLSPIRDAISAVAKKIVVVKTGTVVSASTAMARTQVVVDGDPDQIPVEALGLNQRYPAGTRVALLAYSQGGLLVLGATETDALATFQATAFPTGTGAWTPYTPAWTSSGTAPALGNGIIQGSYTKVGRLVTARGAIFMGSTTTYGTGLWFFSLPVPWVGDMQTPYGPVWIRDTSAGFDYTFMAVAQSSTTFLLRRGNGTGSIVTSADPITFANGDWISWNLTYEAAS